jgi:hypothetical protein
MSPSRVREMAYAISQGAALHHVPDVTSISDVVTNQ